MRENSPSTERTSCLPLLAAAAPIALLIICFKRFVATPGDLFSSPATMLHKLLEPERYWTVIRWYVRRSFRFGHWVIVPGPLLLIGFYLAMGKKAGRCRGTGFRASVAALVLTVAGYFAVYLITPLDIDWHLRFSLDRLFLQVWPSVIFLGLLYVGGVSEKSAG